MTSAENKPLPAIPAKRYFTIGEVSELCGVKAYVLRYWEQEFTQLKPMKRRGNRRYYQHHEVLLIRRIRDLLYEQGFTISGARNQLVDAGAGHAHALAQSHSGAHDADEAMHAAEEEALRHARAEEAPGEGGAEAATPPRAVARKGARAGKATPTASAAPAGIPASESGDVLDEAALTQLAARDLATIAQARLALALADPSAPAASSDHMTLGTTPSTGLVATRTIALQARPSALNATAPAPLDAVYTPTQIREELVAIRSLLVG